jgi:hypothetical protein
MEYNNANSSVSEDLNRALRRCVDYNPETGVLVWREKYSRFSPIKVGSEIGSPNKSGLHFSFARKDLLCHRVAWFLYYGEWPETFLDHKNGCPKDNRLQNLRLATRSQNTINRKSHKNTTSPYLGVCLVTKSQKWRASIGSSRTYLGEYDSEVKAAKAYNKAAKELYGEYARLNNI